VGLKREEKCAIFSGKHIFQIPQIPYQSILTSYLIHGLFNDTVNS
jgi:hypothetical protein